MRSINDIADDIEKYVYQSIRLEMTYKHLRILMHNSPLYNFRDALSHYIRLHETKDNNEKVSQETSINEHLSRGIKDSCFTLIDNMKERITDVLKNLLLRKNREQIFRKQLHLYKSMEIELRKNSIMLSIGDLEPLIDNLINAIRDTENMFVNDNQKFKINVNIGLPA